MDDIDAAFDDAYRTHRIEAGDDPSGLPNPYSRPTLTGGASTSQVATGSKGDTVGGGGGFIVDEEDSAAGGGGGFIVDDDDAAAAGGGGGGFMPEDGDDDHVASSSSPPIPRPATIPLSAIPDALSNLGLDSTDPSVLSLFAETAYTPSASRRRLAPGVKPDKVVGRQEFQQVASILLDELKSRTRPDRDEVEMAQSGHRRPSRRAAVQGRRKAAETIGDDDAEAEGEAGGGGFVVDPEADDSEEDFEASSRRRGNRMDMGSDWTSEEEEVDDSRRRRRRGRGGAIRPSASPSDSEPEQASSKRRRRQKSPAALHSTHLNPLQRTTATDLFTLLLDRLPASPLPPTQRRIGIPELTTILSELNDTSIPAKEVEEMIEQGAKLFAPACQEAETRSSAAIKGAAAAQGISGASVGLDEFAGILVYNRLL